MTFHVHFSSKYHHNQQHNYESEDRSELRCLQTTSETDQQVVVYVFALHNWLVIKDVARRKIKRRQHYPSLSPPFFSLPIPPSPAMGGLDERSKLPRSPGEVEFGCILADKSGEVAARENDFCDIFSM